MKISYKTDYSLKVILDLSNHYDKRLVHIDELSKRQDIPRKFLEQLLLSLKKGGFVQSKKGPNGGYSLTCEPGKIMLGDIVRFVEGTVYPISCIDPKAKQTCDCVSKCAFTGIWREVEGAISGIIDRFSFADLLKKETRMLEQIAIDYEI